MINYEKIKNGKGLTPNQKRVREIYLKHQLNLEGEPIKPHSFLKGVKVRIMEESIYCNCSRTLGKTYLVYDNNQKENIRIVLDEKIEYFNKYYNRYPKLIDDVYIVLGKKNIIGHKKGKCGEFDGIWSFYDNKGIYSTIHPSINHRKKTEIDYGFTKTVISKRKFDKKWFYAHGKTRDEAKKDLKYKIVNYIKRKKYDLRQSRFNEFFKKLRFDSIINIRRYRFLTGACQFGCEQFADRNNLPHNARIKVSDLLRILTDNDYGYYKLINALGIELR